MSDSRGGRLQQLIKGIPVFAHLSPSQLRSIVGICTARTLADGDTLFDRGDEPRELYIILGGAIAMLREDGLELARFEPVTTVGEVGLVAARPRSVAMKSVGQSQLMVVPRKRLDLLLAEDLRMAVTLYRNLVTLLTERVDEDNVRAFEHEEVRSRLSRVERELEMTMAALVIADVKMPNVDGLELLARLKQERPDLPVIGLSGYFKEEQTQGLGFDDFLVKPRRVAARRNLVQQHLPAAD